MDASAKRTSSSSEPEGSAQLPRGRHGLSREFVLSNQRERIVRAMVEVAAERGYAETVVAEVIKHAGVSRKTFYDNFKGKEECFLAAYDTVSSELSRTAIEAYEEADDWPHGVRQALRASLRMLVLDQAAARVAFVEVLAAGPQALERYEAAIRRFVPLMERGREQVEHGGEVPPKVAVEVIGGVAQAMYLKILEGDALSLERSFEELLYFALVPFVGHERARSITLGAD
jgi:AcrR family transcriptional regulator